MQCDHHSIQAFTIHSHTLALCKATLDHLQVLRSKDSILATMATQEDLATLFSRNLNLHNNTYVAPQPEPLPAEEPITYSISQHYHHSAHVVAQQPSRPASEPPQTDQLTTEIILSRHGVDANSLFPSQIDLFKTADPSQQMRLVELWRICPPDYGGHALAHDIGNWPTTSFQQEEAMAKLRYERQIMEERMSRAGGDMQSMDSDNMSDSSATMPMTPIQGGDGRWSGNSQNAEPYMASGYETLAAREYEASARPSKDVYSHFGTEVGGPTYTSATDPVYKTVEDMHKYPNVGGDWESLLQQRQMAMENQYGAFEQQFQHNAEGFTVAEDEEML
ncbi:hypothetical protein LSUB1_G007433 [Lachnellula subtilissima]|uniref:Uncharacterized protein n=1 Tax=Lachnellula subtilissima TaxID=602034 RepID=A0A8H8U5X5_9HELO|nr:hypothetical protein LSUB1_G007433 [Lachnellula subtilissima]